MRVEISKLHQNLGNTMIYVTHDQVEAMTMADKIVVLNSGRIEQVGAPLDLYNKPVNKFVAGFIGSPKMNFMEAELVQSDNGMTSVRLNGQEISLPRPIATAKVGDRLTFGARPEHLTVGGEGTVIGEAKVDLVEHLGGQTILYVSMKGGQSLTIALDDQQPVHTGEKIRVRADPGRCHLFAPDGKAI
jgi:multiple sugar transport system ATP-binding protein